MRILAASYLSVRLSAFPHGTTRDQYTFLIISRSVLLRMRNISDKRMDNQNAHFVFSNFFFRKSCHLWDNVEKYCRDGQATDDNMANVNCMLDNKHYKHTLKIRNNRCFYMDANVTRTRLTVTLHAHWLSCFLLSPVRQQFHLPPHKTPLAPTIYVTPKH